MGGPPVRGTIIKVVLYSRSWLIILTEALLIKETTLGRGGDCGLKAYEVVRFAIVSSVRGRQCPVGEGRRSSGLVSLDQN